MEYIKIEKLSFTYPEQSIKALKNVCVSVNSGEFVTLCGPSGSGKSTLLRLLKPSLSPHGNKEGVILLKGQALDEFDEKTQATVIGFVFQNPENQIATDKVWHELAFGLESLGYEASIIRRRVAEMASFFGIQDWYYKSVEELSGGQKQLLSLAAVMVMQPSVLILDEPTSQLDPIAATDFLSIIGRINRELGTTIIIAEHRLDEIISYTEKLVVMDKGSIICQGKPSEVGKWLKDNKHTMFDSMPVPMRIYSQVPNELECPITVRDGRRWIDDIARTHKINDIPMCKVLSHHIDAPAIETDEVWFKYERNGCDVIKGLSFKAYKGEVTTILGGNGTGKTTALYLMTGINRPYRGKVKINGKLIDSYKNQLFDGLLGMVPQNPQTLFVKKTLGEDLEEMLKGKGLSKEEIADRISSTASLCRLNSLLERHPYDLSGGEQQRAAMAKVLLLRPRILLMDEPTKGIDSSFKKTMGEILRSLTDHGIAVIMVSHDIEFCSEYGDRCEMFYDGQIVAEDCPQKFFAGNSFYTTAANRMCRHIIPEAVTPKQVIEACGGQLPQENKFNDNTETYYYYSKITEDVRIKDAVKSKAGSKPRSFNKRLLGAMLMILIAIPLTILFGVYFLGNRKYLFISLLVMLETMVPFAMNFENRKPQARELVVISVLSALAVAGRAAFFMLPQFKPVAAIVIIAGVAFGAESGFLVGSSSMLVSNMLFSQGTWTPWQMFSMGIIGFIGGVLFKKGLLKRKRLPLCIFGAFAVIIVYGGIMNPASVIMYQSNITWRLIIASYISGFPMDVVHASATVIFLWLLSQPMLDKLDRIKTKYGILE